MIDPCQQCPHVVVVVGLECFSDLLGYAVEPLVSDCEILKAKRHTGVYAGRVWSRFASGTRLLIRRACVSEPATA